MSNIYESSELIGAFLDEAEEHLQFLEQNILELEQSEETSETIQKIFRSAHTLKGSSASMGYDKMTMLTHEMENVLDKIRNHVFKVTKPVIDVLFQCLDCLRLLKEDFLLKKNDTQVDISKVLQELKEVQSDDEKLLRTEEDQKHTELSLELEEEDKIKLQRGVKDGFMPFLCEIKISEESFMKATRACLIFNELNEMGKVVASNPEVIELPDEWEEGVVQYLLLSKLTLEEIQFKAAHELMDIKSAKISPYKIEEEKPQEKSEEIERKEGSKGTAEHEKRTSQTVRVDIERLEQMMNLIGEMVIEQTRIAQVGSTLHNRYSTDEDVEDLLGISNHVSRVVSELQESVMKARMLPVQQLFNRLPRIVRDLSQSLNKEVNLVLEGGETEMDRTIIEEISDPLIHLVRNCLDHGIETVEVRKDKGKLEEGKLKIKAFHQENHVILTIEDDGAGLDLEKIKNSALKKEVITAQEAETMSEPEIINLIFHTGLSTAAKISDVSGRGVGMDIVRNHIDKLNGMIDVETTLGQGTKFTIKLPLTLAILTGLLVKIHNEIYAIPMSNIVEIVRKPKSEIESVKKQSVVMIRDKVHPLIWMHDYFQLPREKSKKNVFIVVLGVAEKRFGIVVDELVGNQEIVVKPLGGYIGKVEGISGATILGDGSVACIFDVVGMSRIIKNRVAVEN